MPAPKRKPAPKRRAKETPPRKATVRGTRDAQAAAAAPDDTALEDSGAPQPSGLVVHRSAEQRRLDELHRDHDRLLREISKKRDTLSALEERAQAGFALLIERLAPVRDEFVRVVTETHALFGVELLGAKSPLNRRDRVKVRRVFAEWLESLPREVLEELEANAEPRAQEDLEGAPDDERAERGSGSQRSSARNKRPSADARSAPDAGYSAPKHDERRAGTLRSIFRRLSIALHPDKAQAEDEKAERTALMKDINRAYESGDVARLLEFERSHLARAAQSNDPEELLRELERVLRANQELRRQLRALTAEIKELKASVPFSLTATPSKSGPNKAIDLMVRELEAELNVQREVFTFTQRFVQRKISLREFLNGPVLEHSVDLGELLEEMLADLEFDFDDVIPSPPRSSRKAASGRKRR